MAQRRQESEAFMEHPVLEVEVGEERGMTAPKPSPIISQRQGCHHLQGPELDQRDWGQIPQQPGLRTLPFG